MWTQIGAVWSGPYCLPVCKNRFEMFARIISRRHKQTTFSGAGFLITKTCLYKFDPLKPHIYIVKLGFTGVYIIFLISAQNINCGYSLEPPRRGGCNEYPQSMCLSRSRENIRIFYLKIFIFLMVKFSVYLNRRVFVMLASLGLSYRSS